VTQPYEERKHSWRYQLFRVRFRLFVLLHACVAAAFWFLMSALSGKLNQSGYGWVIWVAVAAWVICAFPSIVIQMQTLADILSFVSSGTIHYYPLAMAMIEAGEYERRFASYRHSRRRFITAYAAIAYLAGTAFPISAIAAWGMLVVQRLPNTAHRTIREARVTRKKLEFALVEDIADRLGGSPRPIAA
jgi:hypothetical protein